LGACLFISCRNRGPWHPSRAIREIAWCAAVAALLALVFAPGEAAPVSYIAGVAGPLIGADLLHLEVEQSAVGMASIGGAGTFDGIVL
jgi:uncharacterized membrane protein